MVTPLTLPTKEGDYLQLIVYNSLAANPIRCVAHILTDEGNIVHIPYQNITPAIGRTWETFGAPDSSIKMPLPEGTLIGCIVYSIDAAHPKKGQTYSQLGLGRRSDHVIDLASGYVTEGIGLYWALGGGRFEDSLKGQGYIDSVLSANPVAGAECLITVPANARWKPQALRLVLVTDATVINRSIRILIDDGTNAIWDSLVTPDQAATLTYTYIFEVGLQVDEVAIDTFNVIRRKLPPLTLTESYRIRTVSNNLQAGDDYGAPRTLTQEWIEP